MEGTVKEESIKTLDEGEIPEKAEDSNEILEKNEERERQWWIDNPEALSNLYPSLNDPFFNKKIAEKKEFNDNRLDEKKYEINERAKDLCLKEFELAPHQHFVKNFLSFQTPYNSVLLYHGLGTGKTCSAIGIAEEMRDYIKQIGTSQRIIVVASPNVQDNFKLQLFDESKLKIVNGLWNLQTCVGNKLLKEVNPLNQKGFPKSKIVSMIKTIINNSYVFMGYGEFANTIERHSEIQSVSVENREKLIKKKLNDFFNNRLIIIDEVHNIRISDDKKGKKIAEQIRKLVKNVENLRLLFLSATPLYNSYKEIVDLLNIMNMNDNRSTISIKDIFDSDGNLVEGGKELLERKANGYISFVKGDNPYSFPFRVWPYDFNPEKTLLDIPYPEYSLTGDKIGKKIKHLSLYINELSGYQGLGYSYIINNLSSQSKGVIKNLDSLGYIELQKPLEALNIVYPNNNLAEEMLDADIQVEDIVGKNGLFKTMDFKTTITPPFKGDFEYKSEILDTFGRIFSPENISTFSAKISAITQNIMNSEGVCLIYTHYVDGGVVPIALALEELGITRYGDTNSLFKKSPVLPLDLRDYTNNSNKDAIHAKYIAITGDRTISPNNKKEISAATNSDNINGNNVKVIIITQAGSEGIDFKFVRQVHIMEPWYNLSRIEQIIGRGVRNCSHILLPFEKRNVQIYLYGSILIEKEEEAADLYVYRIAEDKAEKIGKITRILKEISIDCLLNQSQNNYNADILDKNVLIKLSNLKEIKYQVGDKPFTAQCDYLESCFYKCKPSNIIDDINNLSNTDFFIFNNNEVIIKKIKDLFTEKYYYSKSDLIKLINLVKIYPIEHINASISELIEDKSNFLIDKYGRLGNLINIGDLYFFQPIELTDKNISLFDRSVPLTYKHKGITLNPNDIVFNEKLPKTEEKKKLSLKLGKSKLTKDDSIIKDSEIKQETEKSIEKPEVSVIESIDFKEGQKIMRTIISNNNSVKEKHKLTRGETDWYKYASVIVKELIKIGKNPAILDEIILIHSLEMLMKQDIINLLNYLYNNTKLLPLEEKVKLYFNNQIMSDGKIKTILVENWNEKTKKPSTQLLIFKDKRWLEAESEDYKDVEELIKAKIVPKSEWNDIMGFIVNFKNNYMVFKIKDDKPGTLGARCDQGGKTNDTRLNYLLGENYFKSENIKTKSIIELCVWQEILMRLANIESRNNKIWFMNPITYILSN